MVILIRRREGKELQVSPFEELSASERDIAQAVMRRIIRINGGMCEGGGGIQDEEFPGFTERIAEAIEYRMNQLHPEFHTLIVTKIVPG